MDASEVSSILSSAPSSPLSSPPSSPSPPPEMRPLFRHYPSPPTSQDSRQTSNSNTPTPDGMDSSASTDKEGPPPAKRRRISKERTTEYLDLRSSDVEPDQQPQLDTLLNVLQNRQKIVVIAGAGISVSAGSKTYLHASTLVHHANDALQYLTSAHLPGSSKVSRTSTNSEAPANTYSTRPCTKMTRQPHPSTT